MYALGLTCLTLATPTTPFMIMAPTHPKHPLPTPPEPKKSPAQEFLATLNRETADDEGIAEWTRVQKWTSSDLGVKPSTADQQRRTLLASKASIALGTILRPDAAMRRMRLDWWGLRDESVAVGLSTSQTPSMPIQPWQALGTMPFLTLRWHCDRSPEEPETLFWTLEALLLDVVTRQERLVDSGALVDVAALPNLRIPYVTGPDAQEEHLEFWETLAHQAPSLYQQLQPPGLSAEQLADSWVHAELEIGADVPALAQDPHGVEGARLLQTLRQHFLSTASPDQPAPMVHFALPEPSLHAWHCLEALFRFEADPTATITLAGETAFSLAMLLRWDQGQPSSGDVDFDADDLDDDHAPPPQSQLRLLLDDMARQAISLHGEAETLRRLFQDPTKSGVSLLRAAAGALNHEGLVWLEKMHGRRMKTLGDHGADAEVLRVAAEAWNAEKKAAIFQLTDESMTWAHQGRLPEVMALVKMLCPQMPSADDQPPSHDQAQSAPAPETLEIMAEVALRLSRRLLPETLMQQQPSAGAVAAVTAWRDQIEGHRAAFTKAADPLDALLAAPRVFRIRRNAPA